MTGDRTIVRGATTPASNDGSFAPRRLTEADPATIDADPLGETCIECGDRRGWWVAPDPATGDPMQVQCRSCAERDH